MGLIENDVVLDESVALCTESCITAPQHAKIIRLWKDGELDELEPVDQGNIATLRLKSALAEMNAAHLVMNSAESSATATSSSS